MFQKSQNQSAVQSAIIALGKASHHRKNTNNPFWLLVEAFDEADSISMKLRTKVVCKAASMNAWVLDEWLKQGLSKSDPIGHIYALLLMCDAKNERFKLRVRNQVKKLARAYYEQWQYELLERALAAGRAYCKKEAA